MKRIPTVIIGIPAYNEEENILELLKNLLKQKQESFLLEKIIVVSDASTDGTDKKVKEVKNVKIMLIKNTRRIGQAETQNIIFKNANSDIVVLINADTLIKDKLFASRLVSPIIRQVAELTSARVQELPATNFLESLLFTSMQFKKYVFESYKQGNNLYTCHGRARSFSKNLYKKLIFKNSVGEDAYSYLFAKKHGFRYQSVNNTEIYYKLPALLKDHEKQSIRFYTSRKRFFKEFGKGYVMSEYHIPLSFYIHSFIKFVFLDIKLPLYILLAMYLKLKSYVKNSEELWTPAVSSKKLITYEK